MAENHPFTIEIEQDADDDRRFRWIIYDGAKVCARATHVYATIRHAKADAEKVMQKLITARQTGA